MLYPITTLIAIDQQTGARVENGSGYVFAVSDTARATPLNVFDLSALPLTSNLLTTNSEALIPPFQVEGEWQVVFVSGDSEIILTSYLGLKEEAAASADAANNVVARADNGEFKGATGDSAYQVWLSLGNTGTVDDYRADIEGPPGLNGSNVLPTSQAIEQEVTTAGTATNTALQTTYATLDAQGRQPVYKGELLFNVLDFGAVGDGVTNDAPAINDATAAANAASFVGPATVWLPWTPNGYGASALVPASNVTVRGENRVRIKKVGGTNAQWLNIAGVNNFVFENLTIDPNGLVTSAAMRAATGTTNFTVRRCTFETSAPLGASVNMYDTQAGTTDLLIEDCWFKNCKDNIRINQGPQRVTIRRNLFTGWAERCIYILGSTTEGIADLTVEYNFCRDGDSTGAVRQPITIQGFDSALHKRVKVNFNTVIGNGTSHGAGTGTADQISLHRCEDFEVIGNISVDGGEVGITVAQQCRRGVVANNVVTGSDGVGIAFGSGSSLSTDDIAVTGNTVMNNGHNDAADTSAAGLVGIYFYHASNITVTGNRVGDDQATPTQPYAYHLTNSSGIRFVGNQTAGNTLGVYDLNTGNTDISEASMTTLVA